MTEADWLACTDPRPMLQSLNMRTRARAGRQGRTSDLERFRLFACACCRRLWHLLRQADQEAVQVLEAYTQSLDRKELLKARKMHRPAGNQAGNEMSLVSRDHPASESLLLTAWARNLASSVVWEATATKPTSSANAHLSAARAVGSLQRAGTTEGRGEPGPVKRPTINWCIVSEEELAAQAALLRDIFGPIPFRPITLDPAWRTPEVVALAQAAYDQRELPSGTLDITRLAVLADALGDAGCTDQTILGHLRGPGPHVRGCWAVDLILGKS
jgi:hypothetical protein